MARPETSNQIRKWARKHAELVRKMTKSCRGPKRIKSKKCKMAEQAWIKHRKIMRPTHD